MNAPFRSAAPAREPLWHGMHDTAGFNEQLRHQCVLDLDLAREAKTDEALAAWVHKWGRNVEALVWSDRR